MMRLWYRFANAQFVERLYVQWSFEASFGAEVMRRGRLEHSRPHRETP